MDFDDVLYFVKGYGSVITREKYSEKGYKLSGLILFVGMPIIFTALACRLDYKDLKGDEDA